MGCTSNPTIRARSVSISLWYKIVKRRWLLMKCLGSPASCVPQARERVWALENKDATRARFAKIITSTKPATFPNSSNALSKWGAHLSLCLEPDRKTHLVHLDGNSRLFTIFYHSRGKVIEYPEKQACSHRLLTNQSGTRREDSNKTPTTARGVEETLCEVHILEGRTVVCIAGDIHTNEYSNSI